LFDAGPDVGRQLAFVEALLPEATPPPSIVNRTVFGAQPHGNASRKYQVYPHEYGLAAKRPYSAPRILNFEKRKPL
jgi:hypothetical protein